MYKQSFHFVSSFCYSNCIYWQHKTMRERERRREVKPKGKQSQAKCYAYEIKRNGIMIHTHTWKLYRCRSIDNNQLNGLLEQKCCQIEWMVTQLNRNDILAMWYCCKDDNLANRATRWNNWLHKQCNSKERRKQNDKARETELVRDSAKGHKQSNMNTRRRWKMVHPLFAKAKTNATLDWYS